jgi:hypothetical protein
MLGEKTVQSNEHAVLLFWRILGKLSSKQREN